MKRESKQTDKRQQQQQKKSGCLDYWTLAAASCKIGFTLIDMSMGKSNFNCIKRVATLKEKTRLKRIIRKRE